MSRLRGLGRFSWIKNPEYFLSGFYRGVTDKCISYFNGTTAYAVSTSRIIDLDAVDPSFTFKWWGDLSSNGTFFSQNVSSSNSATEFKIYAIPTGSTDFLLVMGGTTQTLLVDASPYFGYGVWSVEYNNSLAEIYVKKDGVLLNTVTSVSIGAVREPTAKFKYMARSNNSIDSQAFFKEGNSKDVNIEHNNNIVILPMDECDFNLDGTITYIDRGTGGFDAVGYNVEISSDEEATIVFFGASIMELTFGIDEYLSIRGAMQSNNLSNNINVVHEGVSGRTIVGYLARIDGLLSDLAGRQNVVVFVHGPGNNVSDTRPYATATAGELSEIDDGMNTIVDKILAAGFECALSNITYRSYTAPDVPPESNGSLPYNTNIIEPIIQAKCSNVWDSGLSEPYFNLYDLFKDNPSYISVDNIHPTDVGKDALRDYVFSRMYAKYPTLRKGGQAAWIDSEPWVDSEPWFD